MSKALRKTTTTKKTKVRALPSNKSGFCVICKTWHEGAIVKVSR